MRALYCGFLLAAMSAASGAVAADSGHGQVLAQSHCAPCHIIAPNQRGEVAAAPPFDVIGRKHGFDVEMLAQAMRAPHPKMNFSPSAADAADIAAYIGTLPR